MTDEERWRFETGGLLKAGETQEQAIIRWKGGPRTLDKIRDRSGARRPRTRTRPG